MKHSWINADFAVPRSTDIVLCMDSSSGYHLLYWDTVAWYKIGKDSVKPDVYTGAIVHWQPIVPPEV